MDHRLLYKSKKIYTDNVCHNKWKTLFIILCQKVTKVIDIVTHCPIRRVSCEECDFHSLNFTPRLVVIIKWPPFNYFRQEKWGLLRYPCQILYVVTYSCFTLFLFKYISLFIDTIGFSTHWQVLFLVMCTIVVDIGWRRSTVDATPSVQTV